MTDYPGLEFNPPKLKAGDRDEHVMARCCPRDSLLKYKRKVYALRRLVAGDFSALLDDSPPAAQSDPEKGKPGLMQFYNLIVDQVQDHHSNRLLEAVKQAMMSISYNRADVEFEDLTGRLALVNANWVKQVIAPTPIGCGAVEEMRMGLIDFLTGGFGWSGVWYRGRGPCMSACDTLDMNWDRTSLTVSGHKWRSCRYTETAAYWLSMFGKKAMGDGWEAKVENLDNLVTMEWYYDLDTGPNGSMYVLRVDSGSGEAKSVVYQGENPCYFNRAGQRVPFLPYTPMFYMPLLNVSEPVGMVEMMLSDQIGIWKTEDYIDAVIERGKPFFKIKKNAFQNDSNARERFMRGELGAAVDVTSADDITREEGLTVPADVYNTRGYHERRLTGMAGLNPYASGAPIEGIEYAAEVNQIAGNSNLTVGYASEEHAMWWTESVRKLLALGALYDDRAMEIPVGNATIVFDAYNPVKTYLRPNAEIVISADKMAFRPRAQRIAEAKRDLEVAMQLAKEFPQAVPLAYEKYLQAIGEKNIAAYMEAPAAPAAAIPPGMPVDPQQQLAAGTV